MYDVELARADDGVNVAVWELLSYDTVAATLVPSAFFSEKLEPLMVVASIARENVALTGALVETPVAPLAGLVETTVGGPGGPLAPVGTTSIAAISGSSAEP